MAFALWGVSDRQSDAERRTASLAIALRLHRPAVDVELNVKIANFEDRPFLDGSGRFSGEDLGHLCRGSSASRIPSPIRLMQSAVVTSAMAGNASGQSLPSWISSSYWLSRLPQLGSGGGTL